MPISPNFTSIFSKDWEINFTQCFPNGYLKYTDLCNLLQLTAAAHSEVGGISFSDMQQFNQAWVLSKMLVEIDELPKWKDIITVKTWICTLENSRSIRAMEVYLGQKKIISCETFWAVINTKTRRPESLALPHQHFEWYPNQKATNHSFSKINLTIENKILEKKTVKISDLDIVNHVNNVKYFEWCLDLLDEQLILNQEIESFEMNFLKELSLNDQVTIEEKTISESLIYCISKDNKTCFALKLNFK